MAAPHLAFEVCVLIPYYNNPEGLKKSLRSISFEGKKLAVLIVDDGSAEPLKPEQVQPEIQAGISLFVQRENQNRGITHTLNAGLKWILENLQVPYIARLDCGDTCEADRFVKQVNFLNVNPEVYLLGSWCIFQDPVSGFSYTYTTPQDHAAIIKELHYRNVFIHPTVMFRREVVTKVGFYPEDFPHVEDYAFFMKIARHFNTAILPDFLVTCEINPRGISMANRLKQLEGRAQVVKAFGKNPVFVKKGLFRLWLLRRLPYSWILKWKAFRSKP